MFEKSRALLAHNPAIRSHQWTNARIYHHPFGSHHPSPNSQKRFETRRSANSDPVRLHLHFARITRNLNTYHPLLEDRGRHETFPSHSPVKTFPSLPSWTGCS